MILDLFKTRKIAQDLDNTPFEEKRRTAIITLYVGDKFQSRNQTIDLGGMLESFTAHYVECSGVPDTYDLWIEGFLDIKGAIFNGRTNSVPIKGDSIYWERLTYDMPAKR